MSVEYKDYYKILGVSKTAGKEEISKAFKKLARKYHPDLNQNDAKAETKFKEVNEAYEVLKDDEKRRLYDQLGPDWQHGQNFQRPPGYENVHFSFGGGGSGFSDFFETLFGGGLGGMRFGQGGGSPFNAGSFGGGSCGGGFGQGFSGGFGQQAQKGQDVEASVTLSLEEAYNGGRKAISLQVSDGSARSLEVNIPAGIKQGGRIRLAGQGSPGFGGGPNGDLFLRVTITHARHFKLENNDIIYDLALAPWEAVLGVKTRIPTMSGEVDLTIAPGTGSGRRLRIKGRGLGSGKDKGDQYVEISIKVPKDLTDEERELWKALQEKSGFNAREGAK